MNIKEITQNSLVHVWQTCCHCGVVPIIGTRYHCNSCSDGPDNDLCEKCYNNYKKGLVKHPKSVSGASMFTPDKHVFSRHEGVLFSNYKSWFENLGSVNPGTPEIKYPLVVRPLFETVIGSLIGTYAFLVVLKKDDPAPILLTALHIMDPLIKQCEIEVNELNCISKILSLKMKTVQLYDPFAENWMLNFLGEAGEMIILPNARIGEEEPLSDKDIASFKVENFSQIQPALLAEHPPQVGEHVWLLSGHDEKVGSEIFEAIVVEITERSMVFSFFNSKKMVKHFSGSPVLNSKAEVVGIAIGYGSLPEKTFGHANHVGNIRKHLEGRI